MIGSLTVLPFPVPTAIEPASQPKCEPAVTPIASVPPIASVTESLVTESLITESLIEPRTEPAEPFEPVTDILADVKTVYILPPLPRLDDLAHQDLNLVTIGAIVAATVFCSVLLHALITRP